MSGGILPGSSPATAPRTKSVWQHRAPIRAHDQHRLVRQQAVATHQCGTAAQAARPAGVLHEGIARDLDGMARLEQLDRRIAEIGARVGDPFLPVALRAAAPASHQPAGDDERPVLAIASGDMRR